MTVEYDKQNKEIGNSSGGCVSDRVEGHDISADR
jgi:hypothetical protein